MFSLPPRNKSLQLIMLFFSDASIIFPKVDRPSFIQRYHDAKRNEQSLWEDTEPSAANRESVQSLLLMTHYNQGAQQPERAWNAHGLAVRTAYKIGLHSKAALADLMRSEMEALKRTWHGCVVLDRLLAMTLGRPGNSS
ncbi:fungal specific transcription factor domain-containing protein [Trichoderma breve]|uniref:Fungal specific transcription factor domain-containing protein n=1 Tax=Trichoderma breve TaxID=2034170 RepID=A0A9W9E2L3_9HYPO|nr:fungal specific transcription factor domain-containing protein [Trichoderma breve]KAJ4855604.1 fungal specific transcription factor domain-containing protein [Trichoderma breve]